MTFQQNAIDLSGIRTPACRCIWDHMSHSATGADILHNKMTVHIPTTGHTCRYIQYIQHTCNTGQYRLYIQIHTDTYTYMHRQSVSCRGFVLLLLPHATPMRSATYPDQLGRGSGRGHRVPIVIGGPMGCAGGRLWPPPTRAVRTGAPKRVWEWVPDRGIKWRGCCPWLSWVGPARCPPPLGMFRACCGHQHIKEYMWPVCGLHMCTCIHMYTHVYTCMPIHAIHAHMDWFQNLQM